MGYDKNLFEVLDNIEIKNKTIVELGSQDIMIPVDELLSKIKDFGGKGLEIKDYIAKNYARLSTKYFYDSIGVKEYVSIDVDGVYDSLKFDLNNNIQKTYSFFTTYDIVTNIGTTEHIFDQKVCFENIHNLCKDGGVIIHALPLDGFENHCFFKYNSYFFEHIAEQNDYEILYMNYYDFSYYQENDSEYIIVVFKKKKNAKFRIGNQNKINGERKIINQFRYNQINKRFKLLSNLDLNKINNIAIFGTRVAGRSAYDFSKEIGKKVVCFIDDYKSGYYEDTDIPIVNYDDFIKDYEKIVDIIFQGNYQKNNKQNRKKSILKVFELSKLICD